jgi:phosphatidylglycerophosphatase A
MDGLTLVATFGQTEPRQWLSLVAAYALAVSLAVLLSRWRLRWQLLACVLLVAVAMPLSQHAESRLGTKDDRRIVVDEAMTFPVATLGLPLWRHPWLLPGALVTSWVLDNRKPPPVAQAQSLPGGIGIVLDDVLANLYTLLLAHLALWLYRRRRRGRPGEDG